MNPDVQKLTTRETQNELLKLLIFFDSFCAKHGFRYSLDGGTLLGAIRHGGFIPWDDDVDVMMPREDFEKLSQCYKEVPEPFYLSCVQAGNSDLPYIKLCTGEFRAQEQMWENVSEEYLWIDVFPVDGVPDGIAKAKSWYRKMSILESIAVALAVSDKVLTGWKGLLKKCLRAACKPFISSTLLFNKLTELAVSNPMNSCNNCGQIVWRNKADNSWFSSDNFEALDSKYFEGYQFKVLRDWDLYLTKVYGDYKQLPPVEKRVSHCAQVWKSYKKDNGEKKSLD